MVRFKMVGRDVNSSPTQYRTWVHDEPDLTGQFYTGLKSGSNDFVDITVYAITDGYSMDGYGDGYSFDGYFNLPLPLEWTSTKRVLPNTIYDSQLAIIDGYAYMFGGAKTNKIHYASLDNPADWIDATDGYDGYDGYAVLPAPLSGSQLAIVDGYIYLFGGNDGYLSDKIYQAPVGDPLHGWRDTGAVLPLKLQNSQLLMDNGILYLFGGLTSTGATNAICTASTSDPLTWTVSGSTLPNNLYGSQVGMIDGYIYLFGGMTGSKSPTANIYKATRAIPTTWSAAGFLPKAGAFGQFFTIGSKGYLAISPNIGNTIPSYTRIFRCNLSNPLSWVNTASTIPGSVSCSQIAVIYDRLFLFGSNAGTAIFACNQKLKYAFTELPVIEYGIKSRMIFNATDNESNPFLSLGFPAWKTDYGS